MLLGAHLRLVVPRNGPLGCYSKCTLLLRVYLILRVKHIYFILSIRICFTPQEYALPLSLFWGNTPGGSYLWKVCCQVRYWL